ncbi:MAG TPA: CoA-transferase, partial [Smithellaceae bacterium]|nr:CoA-transferase [Smithellaceae bacterium]
HAPNVIIGIESGSIGPQPKRLILGVGDNACIENATYCTSLWRLLSDQQNGAYDIGCISGAQVDKYGNLNSTCIFGDGDYLHPVTRLPGSGGANDIASSAKRTVYLMPLQKRRFLERVDYITSCGYIDGPDTRKKYGLPGGGPVAIITNMCIFRFDKKTGEAYLDSVKEGVKPEEIRDNVSWDLKMAPEVKVIEPPTVEQITILRKLDANKMFIGNGLANITFESYMKYLNDMASQ